MDLNKLGFNGKLVKICTRLRKAFAQKMTGNNYFNLDRFFFFQNLQFLTLYGPLEGCRSLNNDRSSENFSDSESSANHDSESHFESKISRFVTALEEHKG